MHIQGVAKLVVQNPGPSCWSFQSRALEHRFPHAMQRLRRPITHYEYNNSRGSATPVCMRRNRFIRRELYQQLILRPAAFRHFDNLRIEPADDVHQILLRGHDAVNVFVDAGDLVDSG